jgi:hypothetical protein
LLREIVLLNMHILNLLLQIKYFIRKLWDFYQSFLCYLDFALVFCNFNLNHSYLVLDILDVHLCGSKYIFLDVGFLVKNAEFVISIDELNSC